jgi:hypothetical protein|tara:strand:+ start:531 stop:689 length:159 start_codon:yes stop_codon:yes gene_type:complete
MIILSIILLLQVLDRLVLEVQMLQVEAEVVLEVIELVGTLKHLVEVGLVRQV